MVRFDGAVGVIAVRELDRCTSFVNECASCFGVVGAGVGYSGRIALTSQVSRSLTGGRTAEYAGGYGIGGDITAGIPLGAWASSAGIVLPEALARFNGPVGIDVTFNANLTGVALDVDLVSTVGSSAVIGVALDRRRD